MINFDSDDDINTDLSDNTDISSSTDNSDMDEQSQRNFLARKRIDDLLEKKRLKPALQATQNIDNLEVDKSTFY